MAFWGLIAVNNFFVIRRNGLMLKAHPVKERPAVCEVEARMIFIVRYLEN